MDFIETLVGLVGKLRLFRTQPDCGFCSSANGKPITRVVRRWRWRGVVALETLNPVVPGHIVVVSRWHTKDAGENPRITARVMQCAAELVAELNAANIIASKGPEASQTFFHLHAHVVPRKEGDGLPMPWTGQVIEKKDVTS
jgi:histidine triad (HIT) family protein